MNTLKKLAKGAFLILIAGIGLAMTQKSGDSLIIVRNNSDYDIDHIYFSAPGKATWSGDDVLKDDEVLEPGEEIEITVPCGTWDVKIVMEDGGECFSYGEDICGSEEVWELDNLDCTDQE